MLIRVPGRNGAELRYLKAILQADQETAVMYVNAMPVLGMTGN